MIARLRSRRALEQDLRATRLAYDRTVQRAERLEIERRRLVARPDGFATWLDFDPDSYEAYLHWMLDGHGEQPPINVRAGLERAGLVGISAPFVDLDCMVRTLEKAAEQSRPGVAYLLRSAVRVLDAAD